MSPAPPPGRSLWRALVLFWVVVTLGAGGTLGVLAWLGAPPALAPRALVPPPQAAPEDEPAASEPMPARPAMEARAPAPVPETLPSAPEPAAPLALPEAPEPPPLPSAGMTRTEHPIPPPDPALLEQGEAGPLPRIGADGREPRQAYARAFDRADTRPRVALAVMGASEPALRRLPGPVGLALAEGPAGLLEAARARGMETLLLLPAEIDAPDPVLARFTGYVGALGAGEVPGWMQQALRERGLLLVDARPGGATPAQAWGRAADLLLEAAPTRGEIDRQLAELERLARERGSALGILPGPQPLMVERVAAWAAGLPERGLVLAPVTAMIRRPSAER
ncbi:divergent polysaccharide deacetylase family protein [Roseomonas marmotae]|uniref:Divergent polysaccharide deacetylase family protein n=1 Tax=Roseomonas marmotae TaxID=2768161 RepID=A0ABS3K9K4_9PROT|nr:divergent polysaccharide deacetylase family protein [Roseomonas marmotae]MBO1074130.1 divergent polysaccharide deacetylase family protein [Roseomonas marmotae]QTI78912.1 divergent polysaccharide deacetylase family protein [Roseomonas marmotae]